jgi:uncharacterized protein (DUF433 family)
MYWQEHIEQNPEVMLGKPVIRGTRITVELILERLGDGWSDDDLLAAWPHLTRDQIRAAQAYAAVCMRTDEVASLEG